MRLLATLLGLALAGFSVAVTQSVGQGIFLPHELRLPPRKADAVGGAAFAKSIETLPQEQREARIWQEVIAGNVPSFLRKLVPVPLKFHGSSATVYVTPDYLAVGSDSDYFFVPMTPYTAQRIADRCRCLLPTPELVDDIYAAAAVKLTPSPIPPTPAMTTVAIFEEHNRTVYAQRQAALGQGALGALVAGDKKDIVICRALADTPGHVAIYGWHKADFKPIQPLYLGHFAYWADYSHGVRLVDTAMEVGGGNMSLEKVLADPALCEWVSNEGPVTSPRYRLTVFPHPDDPAIHASPNQRLSYFAPVKGVRVLIDEPAEVTPKVRLVLYALPNGNTIEQTFGRRLRPDDDWHYDIQHIGAQTRWLRQSSKDESLVVAYVEASNHAWPTWLRGKDPSITRQVVDAIVKRFEGHEVRVTLDSHSGGGAFEFAYLTSVEKVPDQIDRIAFLDSEYNYDKALHFEKLRSWLSAGNHYLCVIAYDDFSARYQGKPFVSAEGGTWGRSHAMLRDLGAEIPIARSNRANPERYESVGGGIVFLLKENPKAEIFHTVQVERNGFIESLLSGTPAEGRGYRYFGPRAYSKYIGE